MPPTINSPTINLRLSLKPPSFPKRIVSFCVGNLFEAKPRLSRIRSSTSLPPSMRTARSDPSSMWIVLVLSRPKATTPASTRAPFWITISWSSFFRPVMPTQRVSLLKFFDLSRTWQSWPCGKIQSPSCSSLIAAKLTNWDSSKPEAWSERSR